jgi:hypothetical protein
MEANRYWDPHNEDPVIFRVVRFLRDARPKLDSRATDSSQQALEPDTPTPAK